MMRKNTVEIKEEKLIQFLNGKFFKSNTNIVSISSHELPEIGLSEQETIRYLYLLSEDGLLTIVRKSPDEDFSQVWRVALKACCIHYFDNKIKERNLHLREWIWWGITSLISIGALIVAIIAL